eukprot:SM000162S02365  [mRNA]  locus=s162:114030:117868:+ [translate_table: standard]
MATALAAVLQSPLVKAPAALALVTASPGAMQRPPIVVPGGCPQLASVKVMGRWGLPPRCSACSRRQAPPSWRTAGTCSSRQPIAWLTIHGAATWTESTGTNDGRAGGLPPDALRQATVQAQQPLAVPAAQSPGPTTSSAELLQRTVSQAAALVFGQPVQLALAMSLECLPGAGCTDGAASPDPGWDQKWQSNATGATWPAFDKDQSTARLIVAGGDLTLPMHGGVVVAPRSHWLAHDCFKAWQHGSKIASVDSLSASEYPLAAPVQIPLAAGDALLMHPWLAWMLAPNTGPSSSAVVTFELRAELASTLPGSESILDRMWRAWPQLLEAIEDSSTYPAGASTKVGAAFWEAEGPGRATHARPGDCTPANMPSCWSRVHQNDLLAWTLRRDVEQLVLEEQWTDALNRLRRLVGIRSKSLWTYLQAGMCSLKSAPRGQLHGRAGRKCLLEDGERFLLQALDGRGREQEVPAMVYQLLRTPDLRSLCSTQSEALAAVADIVQCVFALHEDGSGDARWQDELGQLAVELEACVPEAAAAATQARQV